MEPNPWQSWLLSRLDNAQANELRRLMGLPLVRPGCAAVIRAGRGVLVFKKKCGLPANETGYCRNHRHHAGTPSTH